MSAESWRPTTRSQLERIIDGDLRECSASERALFETHRMAFEETPIVRSAGIESVLLSRDSASAYCIVKMLKVDLRFQTLMAKVAFRSKDAINTRCRCCFINCCRGIASNER